MTRFFEGVGAPAFIDELFGEVASARPQLSKAWG
jgi:hypothetical protein